MDKIEQIKQLILSCEENLKAYNQEYKEYIDSLHNRFFDVKAFRLREKLTI